MKVNKIRIQVIGIVGSGKTTVSKIISKALKAEGLKVKENDIDFIDEEFGDIQPLRIKQIVKFGLEIEIETMDAKYSEN